MNDYFDDTMFTRLERSTKARAGQVMAIFDTIVRGFDRLPAKAKLAEDRVTYSLDTGAANAYIATLDAPITGLTAGLRVRFKAAHDNTTASTLVAGGFIAPLVKNIDDPLELGDIVTGQIVEATYDGTNFQMVATPGAAAAAATAAAASAADADLSEADAEAAAIAAAASAVTAATAADNLRATSTTSLLIAAASKSFTTQAGKAFQVGGFVVAASAANVANYMFGQVTSYSGTTLIVSVTKVGGSGTFADWNIGVSGDLGAVGPEGPGGAGSGDVVGPASAVASRIAIFDGTTGKLLADGGITVTTALGLLAGQTPAANSIPIYTGAGSIGFVVAPANSQSLLAAANYAAMLALLGLTIPANGRIWYSAAGVLASESVFAYDSSLNQLSVGQVEVDSTNGVLASPTSPAVRLGAMIDSRPWPAMRTPDYAAVRLQPMLFGTWNKWAAWPSSSSWSAIGGNGASNYASASYTAFASTNWRTRNRAFRATGTVAAGNHSNIRSSDLRARRSATAGLGGFRTEIVFALGVNTTGFQFFAGMAALDANIPGDPSATVNCFGIGFDAADANSGNFFLMQNDGSGTATRTDTTMARDATSAFRLVLECPVGNASTLYWHLTNLNSGTSVSGSINTDLPAADTPMNIHLNYRNGAVASAAILDMYSMSCDSPLN